MTASNRVLRQITYNFCILKERIELENNHNVIFYKDIKS
jgi:hypothetical protein